MSCNIFLTTVILNIFVCIYVYIYDYQFAGFTFTDNFCTSGNRQCGFLDPEVLKHTEINVFST